MRILVTGANGFVGSRLCAALSAKGIDVVAVVRQLRGVSELAANASVGSVQVMALGDLSETIDWVPLLRDVDVVIHLAGRAHRPSRTCPNVYEEFERANVLATEGFAKQCIRSDVKRFIYISSVKAVAERSSQSSLTEDDNPNPEDAYGKTKLEAERLLTGLAQEGALEVVVLRPPLVYGPAVRANFFWLLRLANTGLPVPLGGAANLRSMIYLENLVDSLINCCIDSRARGVYFVADAQILSVRELFTRLSIALGKTPRFFSPPAGLLRTAARLIRMEPVFARLFDPLVLSTKKIETELGWYPPMHVDEGIQKTVEAFTRQVQELHP